LIINKRITHIGENPYATIVNSKIRPIVIEINSNNTKVQGFTISAKGNLWMALKGIKIDSSYCKFFILNNTY
jgi:hypothetical protein